MAAAEVKAVHQRNLDEVLARLGLLERLNNGELTCEVCSCKISRENIGTIFKKDGKLHVCCNRAECLSAILALAKGLEA